MTNWNFAAVGLASFDRDHRDEYFKRRVRPIAEAESPLPLLDPPRPEPRPAQRTAPPRAIAPPRDEPELIAIVRRLHEGSHLVIGHVLGLEIERINSLRGTACVEWRVPPGQRAMIAFLTAIAASRAAQRKFGARSFDDHCSADAEKIERYAYKVTKSEADAQLLIATVYKEAERLVDARWDDIQFIARALEKLGDEIGQEDLSLLLCCIPKQQGILHRRAFISSDWQRRGLSRPNFDAESREVDAVLSTGSRVRRSDWDGAFDEVLAMGSNNVRMGRLNQGAMVLDSHNWAAGMGSVLGGIVPGSAQISNGELTARIKFSRGSALAQRLAQDLADGLQIPLSVGYKVHRSITDRSTNPETRIATDWEPIEVSLVPVAAKESGTGFRGVAA